MLLKKVGTVDMTLEALDKIEKLLDKQIAKDKQKIESWDAKNFIFMKKGFEESNIDLDDL